MRSRQPSAISYQPRKESTAHRPKYAQGLVLVTVLLLSSCSKAAPVAQPETSVSPPAAGVVPAAAATDPWARYRSVLAGDTPDKQREIFQLGYRFLQEKNRDGALLFFGRALEVYPALADYSLYYLGTLHRDGGQIPEARTAF